MSKKVGILTSTPSFNDNYGAILQAYALQKQLSVLGYEPFIVRYNGYKELVSKEKMLQKKIKGLYMLTFNNKLSFRHKIRLLKTKRQRKYNQSIFKQFKADKLRLSDQSYTYTKLCETPPQAYAFICGSDQVWNPLVHGGINDPGYFLDFVKTGVKRIAYAPSMGVSSIPDTAKKDLKQLLEKFDAVSIREKSGADIIKNVCGMEVPVVLDPTLLLQPSYWSEIEKKINLPKKYIACYRFGRINTTEKQFLKISQRLNLPIVNIPSTSDTAFKTNYDIGPAEFISVIKNATLVLTDSFHATAFSIINHTPFYTFMRDNPENGVTMNSRVTGLLKTMKLEDRLIMPNDPIPNKIDLEIDFTQCESILRELRNQSLEYLTSALGK